MIRARKVVAVRPVALHDLTARADPAAVTLAMHPVRRAAAVAHTAAAVVGITAMDPVNAAQTYGTCAFPNGHQVLVRNTLCSRSAMLPIRRFRSTLRSMEIQLGRCRTAHPDRFRQFRPTDLLRNSDLGRPDFPMMVMQGLRFLELHRSFAAPPAMVLLRHQCRVPICMDRFRQDSFHKAPRLLVCRINGGLVLMVLTARQYALSTIGHHGTRMLEIATNQGFPSTCGSTCVPGILQGILLSGRYACLRTKPGSFAVRVLQKRCGVQ